MWIHGLRSGPPASSSSTRYFPLSLSRPATAQPAEPAPVTMKSKVSDVPATMFPRLRSIRRPDLRPNQTVPERAAGPGFLGFLPLRQRAIGHLRVAGDRLCSRDDHLPHLRVG